MALNLPERFLNKVWPDVRTQCWLWTGACNYDHYPRFKWGKRTLMAHRIAYELQVGAIPEGKQLDHLCCNPSCVNPDHLEIVTPRENLMRSPKTHASRNAAKTHCPKGHPYSGDNLRANKRGQRQCKACHRESAAKHRARKRGHLVT